MIDYTPLCADIRTLANRFAIVTDDTVKELYGNTLVHYLSQQGLRAELLSFPAGEASKTRKTKEVLEDFLLGKCFSRDSAIIALGGGIVTDIAGFLAATYCRGVPLVMIPTTLMAMVDASIGGKNGVNTSQGKNMIGTFYMPHHRWVEPTFLCSLPEREIKNGIVEIIKHGIVADRVYFNWIRDNAAALLALDHLAIKRAVEESTRIKMTIVEADATDKGVRRLLNYGHTVGHAIETVSDYKISHGEAVAMGIVAESRLAVEQGVLGHETFEEIRDIFQIFSIPTELPPYLTLETLFPVMAIDKKSREGRPQIIAICDIGSPVRLDS